MSCMVSMMPEHCLPSNESHLLPALLLSAAMTRSFCPSHSNRDAASSVLINSPLPRDGSGLSVILESNLPTADAASIGPCSFTMASKADRSAEWWTLASVIEALHLRRCRAHLSTLYARIRHRSDNNNFL